MRQKRKARGVCIECGITPASSRCMSCKQKAKVNRDKLKLRRAGFWLTAEKVGR